MTRHDVLCGSSCRYFRDLVVQLLILFSRYSRCDKLYC
jgi:hypothetical protein